MRIHEPELFMFAFKCVFLFKIAFCLSPYTIAAREEKEGEETKIGVKIPSFIGAQRCFKEKAHPVKAQFFNLAVLCAVVCQNCSRRRRNCC